MIQKSARDVVIDAIFEEAGTTNDDAGAFADRILAAITPMIQARESLARWAALEEAERAIYEMSGESVGDAIAAIRALIDAEAKS